MKLYYTIIMVIFVNCILLPFSVAQSQPEPLRCIVIDAGHGGKDPGATNGKLREKDITLAVALKLGELIKSTYPALKVVYTRKTDVFIELQNRSAIANKADADLFISIHTNAAKNRSASGTETFLMGVDKSGASLGVAMRENDVISYEADYTTSYQGYQPGSSESFIIFSLMTYAFQTQSLEMATLVQNEFKENLPMKNRGVKQAGYLVLWRTTMPSILTEIGFISNDTEGAFLASSSGQTQIAKQLLNAIGKYMSRVKTEQITVENTKQSPKIKKSDEQEKIKTTTETIKRTNDIRFRILAAKNEKRIVINSRIFGPYVSVTEEVKEVNSYKYYVESMISYKEALLLHNKIKELFPKAIIVAFRGNEEVALEKAKQQQP